MMQFIITVLSCFSMTMDIVFAFTTTSSLPTLSPTPFSSSPFDPDLASTSWSPTLTQDENGLFGLDIYRALSNSSRPTAIECPHGFQRISSTCSSQNDGLWPACHNGTLQFMHRFSTEMGGSCIDPESTIKSSVSDFLLNEGNFLLHPGAISGWWSPLDDDINASLLRLEIEKALENKFNDNIQSSRCKGVIEFGVTCSLEGGNNDSITTLLSSSDCNEEWFVGQSDDFAPLFSLLFFNGTYILPNWWIDRTTYEFLETVEFGRQRKTRDVGVCGQRLEGMANCAIVLAEEEYSLRDEGNSTIALYMGTEYSAEKFEYLKNNSIGICIVHSNNLSPVETDFIYELYSIYGEVMYGISTLCLFLLLITYATFPVLRNFQGWAILSFVVALLITQLYTNYIVLYLTVASRLCQILSMMGHFTYLSVFAWMNLLAFDLFLNFKGTQMRARHESTNRLKRYARYSLFGWGVPLIIVLIAIALHFTENDVIPLKYGSGSICWLHPYLALNVFFVVPVFLSVIANIVFFVITVVNIWKTHRMTRHALGHDSNVERKRFISELLTYFKISCLMGFSWILGPLSGWVRTSIALFFIFTTVNAFQGIFLFFSFGLNARVRKMWKEKRKSASCCSCVGSSENSTKSSSTYTEIRTQNTSL